MKLSGMIAAALISTLLTLAFSACKAEKNTNSKEETTIRTTEMINTTTAAQNKTENSVQTGMNINLLFGNTVITATLDDSETSKAFLSMLPLTLEMSRYADREYYADIGDLPENGQAIDDFENGDLTYYTAGKSLAIFFGNADNSSQSDLIRMGKITSDLSLFDEIGDNVTVTIAVAESEETKMAYDFSEFTNVEITGVDLSALNDDETSVLYRQAKYCQAMTTADTDTMAQLVAEDVTFTHMSGKQQTRAEYFADIKDSSLRYFKIGIENPIIEVNGKFASINYTSVLDANAYGAKGVYRIAGIHRFERINGEWVATRAANGER